MKVDNVKTPTIATVTFEVKVLKIGGSKCTISVFKQIPQLKPIVMRYNSTKDQNELIANDPLCLSDIQVLGHVVYNNTKYLLFDHQGKIKKIKPPTSGWRAQLTGHESTMDYYYALIELIESSDQIFIAT